MNPEGELCTSFRFSSNRCITEESVYERNVYIKRLPRDLGDLELRAAFEKFGEISSAKVGNLSDSVTQHVVQCKQSSYVTMGERCQRNV